MSALTGILISIAAKVGAPLVKEVLQRQLGTPAGGIAGNVIDMIAGKLGVQVDDLPSQDPAEIGNAIREVEAESAEMLRIGLESQKETNRLLLMQMEPGRPAWTWAWLPAWQWFLLFAWFWTIVLVPLVNGALRSNIQQISLPALPPQTAITRRLAMTISSGRLTRISFALAMTAHRKPFARP